MDKIIFDIIGTIGVTQIIIAYFLLNSGKMSNEDNRFLFLNLFGSIMIIISLINTFNFASFVIEIFWITITLYGFIKKYIKINSNTTSTYVEI